jgi:hypothetical protein
MYESHWSPLGWGEYEYASSSLRVV